MTVSDDASNVVTLLTVAVLSYVVHVPALPGKLFGYVNFVE